MSLRTKLAARKNTLSLLALLALAMVVLLWVQSVLAQPATTARAEPGSSAVLERMAVQDTVTEYYALFGGRSHGDFGSFFTDDGVLDANGVVRQGRDAINALYKSIGGSEGGARIDILINNMRVAVNGETATVDLVWTECGSQTLTAPPTILEQGREHDELVKVSGHWRFKHRVVTNDGGLPKSLLKGYINR